MWHYYGFPLRAGLSILRVVGEALPERDRRYVSAGKRPNGMYKWVGREWQLDTGSAEFRRLLDKAKKWGERNLHGGPHG